MRVSHAQCVRVCNLGAANCVCKRVDISAYKNSTSNMRKHDAISLLTPAALKPASSEGGVLPSSAMRGASTAVGAAPRSIDHTTATPGCRIRCIHPQGGLQMLACGQLQTFIILKWIMKHRPEMPTMDPLAGRYKAADLICPEDRVDLQNLCFSYTAG
ncbi:uncharacterized protein LOC143498892 isoform X1 [Brachyhypopomus gauderio]|uniref:uncharacterized protein LOC143498892 isoform X1 n=1 Tax=Brachyhypopomus gauderio TaxID=698409 RepID=UPI00404303E1